MSSQFLSSDEVREDGLGSSHSTTAKENHMRTVSSKAQGTVAQGGRLGSEGAASQSLQLCKGRKPSQPPTQVWERGDTMPWVPCPTSWSHKCHCYSPGVERGCGLFIAQLRSQDIYWKLSFLKHLKASMLKTGLNSLSCCM